MDLNTKNQTIVAKSIYSYFHVCLHLVTISILLFNKFVLGEVGYGLIARSTNRSINNKALPAFFIVAKEYYGNYKRIDLIIKPWQNEEINGWNFDLSIRAFDCVCGEIIDRANNGWILMTASFWLKILVGGKIMWYKKKKN